MRWHHRLYVTLRGWFGSSNLDRELNEELQFHLDRQVRSNIESGMSPAEARRAASIALGQFDPIREASRDGRSGAWVRQLGRDLSFGTRLLRKSPGFSAAAIAIIALGVGAVTAIFSVVYGVALKPLPFREPERLVNLWTVSPEFGGGHYLVNAADHRDWVAQNQTFEGIAVLRNVANFNLIADDSEPERLLAARISANLLPILGVSPVLGRGFTEEEDEIGNEDKVLLSDTLWRRRFAADPGIVGRTINLSGVPHIVVGVMGADFQYPGREFQIWTPLTINPAELARKESGNNFVAIGRLKPGVTLAQAQSEMSAIAARLGTIYKSNENRGVLLIPTHADMLANIRAALYVMLAAVLCLLLVAALNLSTLLSARAAARQRELAVRLALGATRGRVAMQTIAEIAPLLVVGGAVGVALAAWAVSWFVPLAPVGLPRAENIAINGTVLATSIALLTITGLIASLLPASQAWRSDLTSASREDNRATTGSVRQSRARNLLVVTQIALAVPLLTGGVLLTRTFNSLTAINPGFNPQGVLSVHLALPRSKYRSDAAIAAVTGRIADRASAIPGVSAVGLVNRLPLAGGAQVLTMEFDAPEQRNAMIPAIDSRVITPGYFKAMSIPLIEGRWFDSRDAATAPTVGIIDQRIAKTMWPGESAVGKRMRYPLVLTNNVATPWIEIVGVVGHVIHDGIDLDTCPQAYWNYEQRPQDRMVLVTKTAGDPASLTPMIRRAIHEVDPEQPVYDVRTMSDVVERSLGQRWLNMALLVTFAIAALLLCAIGIYGVIAFGVTRQQREFGIRLALGATRSMIAGGVLRNGLTLASIGTALGLVIAAAITRTMQSLLYGVSAGDLVSYAIATMVVTAVAFLASYLPARRAAAVEPAITLRAD
jgi:putative ABC transport system permease protein